MGFRYVFSDNFFRAEIDPERIGVQHYKEAIIQDIEFAAVQTGARIVIIDNLTYLCNSSEKGDVIFYLIDREGCCRTGKIMKYNRKTGHRIKD